ncbi:SpoVR family protein [Roseovarius sp. A-2]|uniref:SpoVR family protein n=1 Tax=Roseovarius sp. A-2 TaxID=1570360 RepID=UPI00111964D3
MTPSLRRSRADLTGSKPIVHVRDPSRRLVADGTPPARDFIANSESQYGEREVEQLLDAAHSLMQASVFRHRRPATTSLRGERERKRDRLRDEEAAATALPSCLMLGAVSRQPCR